MLIIKVIYFQWAFLDQFSKHLLQIGPILINFKLVMNYLWFNIQCVYNSVKN